MGVLLPNAKPCQIGMIAEARAKTPILPPPHDRLPIGKMLAKALAKYTYEYVDVSKLFGMAIHSKEG